MFKLLIIAALVPAMAMADVSFRSCSNGTPAPASIAVNNCTGDICDITAGQPMHAVARGIVCSYTSSTADVEVLARLTSYGPEHPLSLVINGAIVGGGPIHAGVPFSYVLSANSLDFRIRGIPVLFEIHLIGDGGVPLACARFYVRIR